MNVSIIIPMYNIEKYIEECIKNLIDDNIDQNYEVLIINDGSLDKSREIAERCIANRTNFKIIDKKNGGLSSARNKGIIEAKGEYLFFLDGDDFINIKEILNMFKTAKDYNLDVLIGNGMYFYQDSLKRIQFHQDKKLSKFQNVTTGKEMMNYMIERNCYKMEVWDRLYRRKFLIENSLFFENGLLHEDELFTPLVLFYAIRVKYYGNIKYHYRQREGSINNSIKLKNCLDYIKIADKLYELEDNDEKFKKNLNIRVMQQYLRSIQLASNINYEEYKIFKSQLDKNFLKLYKSISSLPLGIIIRVNLFRNFKSLYYIIYKLYKKIRFIAIGEI